jgi:uncharacterized membrane protein
MAKEASFEGIIVAAYSDEEAADAVLKDLNKAKKEKSLRFWEAAVIRKDERSRYHYDETKDMAAPAGAGIGAVIGGLIGLTGGPAGAVVGAGLGAALGGMAADRDAGIKDDRLEDVGHALIPGNSALVIVSDFEYLQAMRQYAGDEEIREAMHKLTTGISEHMAQGQNVAYILTSAGRSVSCHEIDSETAIAEMMEV